MVEHERNKVGGGHAPVESSIETGLFVPKEERAMLIFFTLESY